MTKEELIATIQDAQNDFDALIADSGKGSERTVYDAAMRLEYLEEQLACHRWSEVEK